jgi:hypothetical protein
VPSRGPQDLLQQELGIFNARNAEGFARLRNYLAAPGGKEILASVDQFRATLGRRDAGAEGREPFQASAEAFVALVREYPPFQDGSGVRVALPVFGEEGPGEHGLRRDAAELITAGAIAIVATNGGDPRDFDTLVRIAIGADDLAGQLRDWLLGHKPFPDDFGVPIPQKLIDLMNEIDRRTCGLAIAHSLSNYGRAVELAKSTAWAGGITSINPAIGCAGTPVTITGNGFGATQPVGVKFAFAGVIGGCVPANVMSWSDTQIVAVAPQDVGAGCIGFIQPGDPSELVTASDSLAGEMQRCMGVATAGAAEQFRTFGSRLIVVCPPCLPLNVNYFQGGPPYIEDFAANGLDAVQLAPGAALNLSWSVRNATSVEIVKLPAPAGQIDELPSPMGPLNAATGSYVFPSVTGTFAWDREYELRARNTCTPPNQPVRKRVTIRMRNRPDCSQGRQRRELDREQADCRPCIRGLRPKPDVRRRQGLGRAGAAPRPDDRRVGAARISARAVGPHVRCELCAHRPNPAPGSANRADHRR